MKQLWAIFMNLPLLCSSPLLSLPLGLFFPASFSMPCLLEKRPHFGAPAIFVLPQDEVIVAAHHVMAWVHWAPTIAALFGVAIAYLLYQFTPALPEKLSQTFKYLYGFLYQQWYFDKLYDWLFVTPTFKTSKILWEEGDQEIIDGLGPNGLGFLSLASGGILCRLQTGYVYHYAFAMIIGVVLMMAWYFWG